MNRRDFFVSSAVAGAATMLTGTAMAENLNKASEAKLRLACSWGFVPAKDDAERITRMKELGFEGIEAGGDGTGALGQKKMFDDAGFKVVALCFGSCGGRIVSEDVSKRQEGIDMLKKAIENANTLEAKVVVYVPAFNGQTKLNPLEVRKIVVDTMPALAEFAAQANTNIVFEPLNRGESWYIRQVADGAAIARDCNKDAIGIGTMGDFYHMAIEEVDDMGAFLSAGKFLKHVHLGNGPQEPRRTLPGQDDRPFAHGFRGLKYLGYNGFATFECGVAGTDRLAEIRKSIAYLRSEWDKAEV
ncbi:MAG: TIM barrel protein [Planctomycetia bacterium]|nr:TIM barrel protein [Planctomycetia bacterium]